MCICVVLTLIGVALSQDVISHIVNMEDRDDAKVLKKKSGHPLNFAACWFGSQTRCPLVWLFQPLYVSHIMGDDGSGGFEGGDYSIAADGWALWPSTKKRPTIFWSSPHVMFLLFVVVEGEEKCFFFICFFFSWAELSPNHLRCSRTLPSCSPPPCRCPTLPLWRSVCPRRSTGSWRCSAPRTARTPAVRAARPRSGDVQNGCRGYRRTAGTPAPCAVPRQWPGMWGCASLAARPTPAAPPRAPGVWRRWSFSSLSFWSGSSRPLSHRGRLRRKTWLSVCTRTRSRRFYPLVSPRCSVSAERGVWLMLLSFFQGAPFFFFQCRRHGGPRNCAEKR